jgi:hypothetical protein
MMGARLEVCRKYGFQKVMDGWSVFITECEVWLTSQHGLNVEALIGWADPWQIEK